MALEARVVANPAFTRALGLLKSPAVPYGLDSDELGDFSEIKVATALMGHPDIDRVIMSKPFSKNDMLERDIITWLRNDLDGEPMYVQVKSSDKGAEIYYDKLKRRIKRLGLNMTVEDWLAMNRIMLIVGNGRTSRQIRASFSEQMLRIWEFHDRSAFLDSHEAS